MVGIIEEKEIKMISAIMFFIYAAGNDVKKALKLAKLVLPEILAETGLIHLIKLSLAPESGNPAGVVYMLSLWLS